MICHVSPSETRHSTAQIRRVTHARFQSVGLSVEAQQARSRVDTSVQEPGLHSQYCAGCDALSVKQNYKKYIQTSTNTADENHILYVLGSTCASWEGKVSESIPAKRKHRHVAKSNDSNNRAKEHS